MSSSSSSANQNPKPDIEAGEATGLLNKDGNSPDRTNGSQETNDSDRLWDELDRPWPATFERSISLLASPVIDAADAEHYTKSPKPGNTPLGRRRRMRGNETPEGTLLPPLTRHKSINEKFSGTSSDANKNLDFKQTKDRLLAQAKLVSISDTQKDQERKAREAAQYRAEVLKKAKREAKSSSSSTYDGVQMSPAYQREMEADRRSRKQKADGATKQGEDMESKATFWQCVFNLANILMGVGLLGLPYACAQAGMVGGIFAVVVFALVTWKTSIMIGRELNGDPRPSSYFDDSPWKTPLAPGSDPRARMLRPISSFPDIARGAFGEAGCVVLSLVLYFELFSCICIFIVTIGDHMHTLFPSIPVTTHMMGVAVVSAIPIIFLRTARLLSYLSMLGTFATVAVVGAVVLAFVFEGDITDKVADKMNDPPPPPYHSPWHTSGLPLAFGLVAYCFSGHAIVPSIYSSMQKPQDFEKVVNLTYVVVLISCLAVGLSGYFMFGTLVHDQVTISLEQNSSAALAMTVLTYLMILTAFSKITLTMFPLALGMEEIVAPYISSEKGMDVISVVIKISLILLALWVAVYVPSFSFLCSMVGMICTMTVSVIFPGAAYLKMFGSKIGFLERIMYWCIVILGAIMAVVGTILSV